MQRRERVVRPDAVRRMHAGGALRMSGGGRLVAFSCVDGAGNLLMPCGRCRQLLYEFGGPDLLVDHPDGIKTLDDLLPSAFGPADLGRDV